MSTDTGKWDEAHLAEEPAVELRSVGYEYAG